MKRALVTGGSGFLGSHIADELSAQGYEVTIFDNRPSPFLKKNQHLEVGDIRDYGRIEALVAKNDFVFHLAALADLNEAKSKAIETAEINILGTLGLLEAARKSNLKRFVFGSSVYVYSQQGGFYRCSKQACENYIEEYGQQYALPFTILRYGSLYGTRTNEKNGVYRLLKQFMSGDTIQYHGSASDKREYIHVEDAARLSVMALQESFSNKHLTLTGNDRLSIAELFTMFGEILNKQVSIQYDLEPGVQSGHYSQTPYTFTPKLGKKVVLNEYVDMGQGLIQVIETIYRELSHENP